MVALLRPDSWDFPLFLHVLGAVVLVGAAATVVVAASRGGPSLLVRRVAFRVVALVALPAWLLMRIAGQWIDSKEDIAGDPAWLAMGYIVGDAGLIVLLLTTLVAWVSTRQPERRWPAQTVAVLSGLYLAALLVSMWAMTTKPE